VDVNERKGGREESDESKEVRKKGRTSNEQKE
jgi:hypothetical protein